MTPPSTRYPGVKTHMPSGVGRGNRPLAVTTGPDGP